MDGLGNKIATEGSAFAKGRAYENLQCRTIDGPVRVNFKHHASSSKAIKPKLKLKLLHSAAHPPAIPPPTPSLTALFQNADMETLTRKLNK